LGFNWKIAVGVCLAVSLAVPAFAQGSGADTYKTKCAMCHGATGLGDTPAGKVFKAASLKDPMVTTKSNDELTVIIKNGKNKMPAWKDKLTEDQIKAVLLFIRTQLPD
jgi:cytochrome c6